jgi:hypothetical protein
MSKDLKKFCRLTKYLEKIDPQLYQAIDDLCIGHYFKPPRTGGITFLYPANDKYRKKIVNAAYSNDPDVAVNMLKSLLVASAYNDPQEMTGELVNLLNQKIQISSSDEKQVKLENGLVLTRDPKFIPMSGRDNMSVFILKGDKEIPLDGPKADFSGESVKRGGQLCETSKKSDLYSLLETVYARDIKEKNNIYVKKVFLQLKYLLDGGASSSELLDYLGNDEISDSYLLDMYCNKSHSKCFGILYKALSESHAEVDAITFDKYIEMKKKVIGESTNKNVLRTAKLFINIRSPMDVRTKIAEIYRDNKSQLARDLFIVFCNINKEMWMSSYYTESAKEYQNFAYIVSKIYTDKNDLIKQEFNVSRDLTLYGNLLRSDVLLYVPQADFRSVDSVDLPIVSELPSPLDMKVFSLCHLVNMHHNKAVTGGDFEVAKLLSGL